MDTITIKMFKEMILQAGNEIEGNEGMLSGLDAAIGDGDHGVSMTRGVCAVRDKLESVEYSDLSSMLVDSGKVLLKEIGGTCGPLFATFYLKMAACIPGKTEVGLSELAEMLRRGLAGVKSLGKAEVGDKTMIDALEPAVRFIETCVGIDGREQQYQDTGYGVQTHSFYAVFNGAAAAAAEGARQTSRLIARKGRARYQGDTSLGHQDAGATSVALMFRGFSAAWQTE